MADDLPGYRPEREDADFYMNYQEGSFLSEQETDFIVKKILLAAYLRMFNLFEADHPNQGSTYWPTGPDGNPLTSHNDVIEAVQTMLSETKISAVRELTAFLYELREFDRTRRYSDSTREQVRAYRLSQAIWASSTELPTRSGAKETLDPNISFFALPRPIAETSH